MKETLLVTGGCRSGKSRFALDFANSHFKKKTFVATCQVLDSEMKKRVRAHQEARGPEWSTVEVPMALPHAVVSHSSNSDVIIIDCMTLWVSNLLVDGVPEKKILASADDLLEAVFQSSSSFLFVTNEVGTGIVPENALARKFRDIAGLVNQKIAAFAGTVIWMVAGIPVTIKGELLANEK